jgi:hypothetical protein
MDHTSLLKYLTGKWSLGPLGYRTQVAGTFDAAFVDSMRDGVLPPIDSHLPVPAIGRPPQMESLNSHSRAMVALSHVLESMAEEDASIVAALTRQVLSGPQSQIDAAFDRFENFLKVRGNR